MAVKWEKNGQQWQEGRLVTIWFYNYYYLKGINVVKAYLPYQFATKLVITVIIIIEIMSFATENGVAIEPSPSHTIVRTQFVHSFKSNICKTVSDPTLQN